MLRAVGADVPRSHSSRMAASCAKSRVPMVWVPCVKPKPSPQASQPEGCYFAGNMRAGDVQAAGGRLNPPASPRWEFLGSRGREPSNQLTCKRKRMVCVKSQMELGSFISASESPKAMRPVQYAYRDAYRCHSLVASAASQEQRRKLVLLRTGIDTTQGTRTSARRQQDEIWNRKQITLSPNTDDSQRKKAGVVDGVLALKAMCSSR